MVASSNAEPRFPVRLSRAQQIVVARIAPGIVRAQKTDGEYRRNVHLTLDGLKTIRERARASLRKTDTSKGNSLRHIIDIADDAIDRFRSLGEIPALERVYQFKITLKNIHPLIWRRIQVRDWTLEKLHEYIQLAMGWTTAPRHRFKINAALYGDPGLAQGKFKRPVCRDSTKTMFGEIVAAAGKKCRFDYDFGDSWKHEIVFEDYLRAEQGLRYPMCLEGQRACPLENVGGVSGYRDFLEAIADTGHVRHGKWLKRSGSFDPNAFDPATATKRMRKGLHTWREML